MREVTTTTEWQPIEFNEAQIAILEAEARAVALRANVSEDCVEAFCSGAQFGRKALEAFDKARRESDALYDAPEAPAQRPTHTADGEEIIGWTKPMPSRPIVWAKPVFRGDDDAD